MNTRKDYLAKIKEMVENSDYNSMNSVQLNNLAENLLIKVRNINPALFDKLVSAKEQKKICHQYQSKQFFVESFVNSINKTRFITALLAQERVSKFCESAPSAIGQWVRSHIHKQGYSNANLPMRNPYSAKHHFCLEFNNHVNTILKLGARLENDNARTVYKVNSNKNQFNEIRVYAEVVDSIANSSVVVRYRAHKEYPGISSVTNTVMSQLAAALCEMECVNGISYGNSGTQEFSIIIDLDESYILPSAVGSQPVDMDVASAYAVPTIKLNETSSNIERTLELYIKDLNKEIDINRSKEDSLNARLKVVRDKISKLFLQRDALVNAIKEFK